MPLFRYLHPVDTGSMWTVKARQSTFMYINNPVCHIIALLPPYPEFQVDRRLCSSVNAKTHYNNPVNPAIHSSASKRQQSYVSA